MILLQSPADVMSETYVLDIGTFQNSKTKLYRKEDNALEVVVDKDTTEILDCYLYQEFWVSYSSDGVIQFGKGNEMEDVIIGYQDDKPLPTHAVSIARKRNSGSSADMEFLRSSGIPTNQSIILYYGIM